MAFDAWSGTSLWAYVWCLSLITGWTSPCSGIHYEQVLSQICLTSSTWHLQLSADPTLSGSCVCSGMPQPRQHTICSTFFPVFAIAAWDRDWAGGYLPPCLPRRLGRNLPPWSRFCPMVRWLRRSNAASPLNPVELASCRGGRVPKARNRLESTWYINGILPWVSKALPFLRLRFCCWSKIFAFLLEKHVFRDEDSKKGYRVNLYPDASGADA